MKDYYVVLGVSRAESTEKIRSAFRALARRYHPDHAGARSTRQFQQIAEAYHVLSDAERRAAYDRGLEHMAGSTGRERASIQTAAPRASGASPEPLIPQRATPMRDVRVGLPPGAWMFDRFAHAFRFGATRRQLRPLRLEVILPRSEAARGGLLSFPVPVFYPCRTCHGSGARGGRPCRMCDGSGMRPDEEPLTIAIPAMVRNGTVIDVPLRGLGVSDMYLELHIVVP